MAVKSVELTFDGLHQMLDRLDFLKHQSRVAIARSVLRSAVTVVAKQIRRDLSAKVKDAGKDVRGFVLKSSKTRLITKAKVGFFWRRRQLPPRSGRRGVGISGNNIHWWLIPPLSSPRRLRTGSRHSTGTMTPQQRGLIRNAIKTSRGRMFEKMHTQFIKQLKREFAKAKKRGE